MTLEHSHPSRHAKIFGGGCVGALRAESGIFEDQGAAIFERDFFGLPGGTLVELVGLGVGWGPFLVKPVQIRLVVGDPFLDGLPRWLDGLHGFDVEGRRGRAREMDSALPEAVEAEEEFDLLAADHGAGGLHRPIAAGAEERVADHKNLIFSHNDDRQQALQSSYVYRDRHTVYRTDGCLTSFHESTAPRLPFMALGRGSSMPLAAELKPFSFGFGGLVTSRLTGNLFLPLLNRAP